MDKSRYTFTHSFRNAVKAAIENCEEKSSLVTLLEKKTTFTKKTPLSPEDWCYILDRREVRKEFLLERVHRSSLIKNIMSLDGRYRENSLKARLTRELESLLASLEKKAEEKAKKEAEQAKGGAK